MRIVPEKKAFTLTALSVDKASEDFSAFLESIGTPHKNQILSRLMFENILLELMSHYDEETEFIYTKSAFLGRPYISISVKGEQFNPLIYDEDDSFGNHTSALISGTTSAPVYEYVRNVNTVTMKFNKKQMNPFLKMFIAFFAAMVVSMLRLVLSENTIEFIKEDFLLPLNNTFLGMMATVELPLLFFSVVCGILGIGNSAVFGKIGRKMVIYFLRFVFVMTTTAGIVFILLFHLSYGSMDSVHIHGGFEMLLNIIPKSLIEPFTGGNSMQMVVMGIVVASVLVLLGEKAKHLTVLANEANSLMFTITSFFTKLLPAYVFIVILNSIWSDEIHIIVGMWKPMAAFVAVLFLCYGFMLVYVSIRESVSVFTLVRKIGPTFLIGLATASSVALNGELYDCLTTKLGINRKFAEFGHPVGSVVFMPSTAVNFLICAIYMAYYYKVSVSALWLMIAILLCAFVAVATPPVPGGALAAYSIIFAQLGIPVSGVAIMVSLDILFDFFDTAFDNSLLALSMVRIASKSDMLDRNQLRKAISAKRDYNS